ncbi:hypothetical protein L3V82_02325 [Thiotrichales bacterium 19S3-7]|nr:hypothetical protein [Thiotrichales bacterium 19S3-7]MCF6801003.1 hypothetical protein [Thiotrichales bacterium 19S3-11]
MVKDRIEALSKFFQNGKMQNFNELSYEKQLEVRNQLLELLGSVFGELNHDETEARKQLADCNREDLILFQLVVKVVYGEAKFEAQSKFDIVSRFLGDIKGFSLEEQNNLRAQALGKITDVIGDSEFKQSVSEGIEQLNSDEILNKQSIDSDFSRKYSEARKVNMLQQDQENERLSSQQKLQVEFLHHIILDYYSGRDGLSAHRKDGSADGYEKYKNIFQNLANFTNLVIDPTSDKAFDSLKKQTIDQPNFDFIAAINTILAACKKDKDNTTFLLNEPSSLKLMRRISDMLKEEPYSRLGCSVEVDADGEYSIKGIDRAKECRENIQKLQADFKIIERELGEIKQQALKDSAIEHRLNQNSLLDKSCQSLHQSFSDNIAKAEKQAFAEIENIQSELQKLKAKIALSKKMVDRNSEEVDECSRKLTEGGVKLEDIGKEIESINELLNGQYKDELHGSVHTHGCRQSLDEIASRIEILERLVGPDAVNGVMEDLNAARHGFDDAAATLKKAQEKAGELIEKVSELQAQSQHSISSSSSLDDSSLSDSGSPSKYDSPPLIDFPVGSSSPFHYGVGLELSLETSARKDNRESIYSHIKDYLKGGVSNEDIFKLHDTLTNRESIHKKYLVDKVSGPYSRFTRFSPNSNKTVQCSKSWHEIEVAMVEKIANNLKLDNPQGVSVKQREDLINQHVFLKGHRDLFIRELNQEKQPPSLFSSQAKPEGESYSQHL